MIRMTEAQAAYVVPVLTTAQAVTYAQVSEALDEEGYGDLLTGQAVDVRDAVAQMQLDAEQMAELSARLHRCWPKLTPRLTKNAARPSRNSPRVTHNELS